MKRFLSLPHHLTVIAAMSAALLLSGTGNCAKKETVSATEKTAAAENVQPSAARDTAGVTSGKKLIVYYFHTNFRCQSCTAIERLTRQAVETGFADELKNGSIELRIVNVEVAGNEHFEKDYKLYTKSVILSDVKNGTEVSWKNCDKIWTLLHDEGKFIDYIQSEIRTELKG